MRSTNLSLSLVELVVRFSVSEPLQNLFLLCPRFQHSSGHIVLAVKVDKPTKVIDENHGCAGLKLDSSRRSRACASESSSRSRSPGARQRRTKTGPVRQGKRRRVGAGVNHCDLVSWHISLNHAALFYISLWNHAELLVHEVTISKNKEKLWVTSS